ncbi:MAG: hypothetical protein JW760_10220 [Spirochaetales bacterium]|nr:hypothetical protein [Spirochaetales bacterium]
MIAKRAFLLLVTVCFTVNIYAVDTSNMREIYNNEILVYAEDCMDYTDFIAAILTSLGELETIFQKKIRSIVSIYIYSSHTSSSLKIFGSETDVIQTAMADPVNLKIYLTSPYDTFKSKEYYYSVPIHELVHLFYSPADLWLREGIAVYLSGQLNNDISLEQINGYSYFYPIKMTNADFLQYYNNFGWLVKYLMEEKLGNSIVRFREFCNSKSKAALLGYRTMDEFIIDWKRWIEKIRPTPASS